MSKPFADKVHYSELSPGLPGSPLEEEWETYRRQVERLIQEGNEGKHVLIKGTEILGVYSSHSEALEEGYRPFLLQREPFLVHQIQTFEPLMRAA